MGAVVKRLVWGLVLCLNATPALCGSDAAEAFARSEGAIRSDSEVPDVPERATRPNTRAFALDDEVAPLPLSDEERRRQRGLTDVRTVFVPKGQWTFGGTASYSTHTNDSYQFLIIEGIGSEGYNFRISPMIAYALSNNMAVGGRFIYSRTLLKLDGANLKFGDDETGTDIRIKDFYALRSSYQAAAIWRQFIPLGQNKRFALFNEMSLTGGGVQAKFANDAPVKGTYERGYTFSLGVSPGIVAFATNNMAIEVNVGVMGISYSRTKQIHNQVTVGHRSSSMMNFKVNIFSIGLGMAFYL